MRYKDQLLDPRWQKIRLEIFNRDGWTCRGCKSSDKQLHAHHIYYLKHAEGPWDYAPESIITLCNKCHEDEHITLEYAKATLFNALAKAGYVSSYDFECFAQMIEGNVYVN